MQLINAYLYPNKVVFQILDSTFFKTRNRVVYNRTIKVYQGVDNPILVTIKNQDQKAVNCTGYSVQVDLQDPINKVTVNSYAVNFANIVLGQGSITIDRATVNSLDQRLYALTVRRIPTGTANSEALYTDDNYGVPIDLEVLPAYYSQVEPSPTVDNSVIDGGVI